MSIITPTREREELLSQTLRWVRDQTWQQLEWLVLDDSAEPSRILTESPDPRLRYEHTRERLTIGEKRNRLIEQARGEFIAHFDDDDYYAPRYLEMMIRSLEANQADFANLCAWYLLDLRHQLFGYWDLRQTTGLHYLCHLDGLRLVNMTPQNNASLTNNHLGYGFTYVYRRRVWEAAKFGATDWGEDTAFVQAAGARFRLLSVSDQTGVVLHTLHGASTSACFPQYRLPDFLLPALFAPCSELVERLRQRARR